jgi:Ca-activated chloride channel family protein
VRWLGPVTGEASERSVEIPVATTGAASPSLRLAAAVAELAEVLRGNALVTDRGITLDTVVADAAALEADHVPGAAELADIARMAAGG